MARTYRHWTLRYIKNRAKVMLDEKLNPDNPWITADSTKLLEQLLKPSDVGVEFGSGRSTIWFAERLSQLTSIEHDKGWHKKVQLLLASKNLTSKVDYRAFANEEEYVSQCNTFSDGSIDFCLIDGVARDKCAKLMLPKLKSGGILVIDNINWFMPNDVTFSPNALRTIDGFKSDVWASVGSQISDWRRIWTSNGVSDTCIWFKR